MEIELLIRFDFELSARRDHYTLKYIVSEGSR